MPSPASRLDEARCLEGVRVLVVDDVPAVLEILAEILTDNGGNVTAVGSAEEALSALQGERPDVLLSDIAMPGRGGYWLIRQVRALPPERGGLTPAVAVTALAGPEHRTSLLRAGFQVHVEKPGGLDALIEIVAMLAPQQRAA